MFTMSPPRDRIASTAARDPHITPRKLTSASIRTSSSECSQAFCVRRMPALLTQTSIGPRSAAAAATARWLAGSRTSWAIAQAPAASRPAVSCAEVSSTSVTSTSRPRAESLRAISRPMPRPAPVTTAVPTCDRLRQDGRRQGRGRMRRRVDRAGLERPDKPWHRPPAAARRSLKAGRRRVGALLRESAVAARFRARTSRASPSSSSPRSTRSASASWRSACCSDSSCGPAPRAARWGRPSSTGCASSSARWPTSRRCS